MIMFPLVLLANVFLTFPTILKRYAFCFFALIVQFVCIVDDRWLEMT